MTTILRLLAQLIPVTLAFFNRKPERENPVPPEKRPDAEKYTSDTDIKILKDFVTQNYYTRPGILRKGVRALEIHWPAMPGKSAKDVRNVFTYRKGGRNRFGSTHFAIDLDGDIIQMIPEKEIAYSSGTKKHLYKDGIVANLTSQPYLYTLSVEVCHLNWAGEMTSETYAALVKWCIHFCKKYGLSAKKNIRHFDITGKECPKWFVDNPQEWNKLRDIIDEALQNE